MNNNSGEINLDSFSPITLLEFCKNHNKHKTIHKLIWLGESILGGKIYYRALFCIDCNYVFILDKVVIWENDFFSK
jgi:hypothetical protein